jgi:hypothetical protein
MKGTPRTLIRGAVKKDVGVVPQEKESGAKDLMRAFISSEEKTSPEHQKILENPAFTGFYPRIVNKVFYLERYASEVTRFQPPQTPSSSRKKNLVAEDPYTTFNPFRYTGFEHCLICINFSLLMGIVMTSCVLGLFFFFVNNALYIKQQIS